VNIFFEIHRDLPREGPGDSRSTRKALSLMTGLPPEPEILDIGCGPGMQTIELARATDGRITAIDTHQEFLEQLTERARREGLSGRITAAWASMMSLPFDEKSFDAIWSEGAIYIIGFEEGLRAWQRFLKPGGYMAVTEVSWLRPQPPEEVRSFWESEYPAIRAIDVNLERIRRAGYRDVGHFILPPSSWWDDYYTPLEGRVAALRKKYRGDEEASRQLDEHEREIDMYRKYVDCYSYVFYVMQLA
jgi:ubiquinone/menaquinone biosynthesis C-methylase UbiE